MFSTTSLLRVTRREGGSRVREGSGTVRCGRAPGESEGSSGRVKKGPPAVELRSDDSDTGSDAGSCARQWGPRIAAATYTGVRPGEGGLSSS